MAERRYIKTGRDTWSPLDVVAADPIQRQAALAWARRQRSPRHFRALIEAFAEHDAASGAEPLIAATMRNAPEPEGWTKAQRVAHLKRRGDRS